MRRPSLWFGFGDGSDLEPGSQQWTHEEGVSFGNPRRLVGFHIPTATEIAGVARTELSLQTRRCHLWETVLALLPHASKTPSHTAGTRPGVSAPYRCISG